MWQRCPLCDGTGTQYDPGLHYAYRLVPVTVGANATVQQSIVIGSYDFRWQELTGESTGSFTFLITDTGVRQFSNVAIHSSEMLGNGQNPFPLLVPYMFAKRATVNIAITDVSGSSNTIALAFIGCNLGEVPAQ